MMLSVNQGSCVLHCRMSRGDVLKFSPLQLHGFKIETVLWSLWEICLPDIHVVASIPFFSVQYLLEKPEGGREGLCPANELKTNHAEGGQFSYLVMLVDLCQLRG